MNLVFRLTLSFLIFTCFAGLGVAYSTNERLDFASFASNPESFAGRTVEVEARVIAINAKGKSLELFDSPSRTRITVQLTQLSKAERMTLMNSDVRKVVVRGQVSVVDGRLTIQAQSVTPVDACVPLTVMP